jgi:hypothetical protein
MTARCSAAALSSCGYPSGTAVISSRRRILSSLSFVISSLLQIRRNPKIRAAINAGLQKLQLSREEIIRAAERILEANPKDLFDENGGFNIAKLPDDLARTIKKIKPGEFGTEVELHSPLVAATLLAKLLGYLENSAIRQSAETFRLRSSSCYSSLYCRRGRRGSG